MYLFRIFSSCGREAKCAYPTSMKYLCIICVRARNIKSENVKKYIGVIYICTKFMPVFGLTGKILIFDWFIRTGRESLIESEVQY